MRFNSDGFVTAQLQDSMMIGINASAVGTRYQTVWLLNYSIKKQHKINCHFCNSLTASGVSLNDTNYDNLSASDEYM